MKPNCIDVSTWQRNIDWSKVKAAGIKAVIIRAGFGQTKDNQFENHYAGAKAAGLKIGAYWYSYAYSTVQAEKEAKACISILSGKSFDLPVYYDVEERNQIALGKMMTSIVCQFLDKINAAGYRAGVYASSSWFTDILDYNLLRSRYSIWLALYWTSSHRLACDIWQYGYYNNISGVTGDCDCNIIENEAILGGSSSTAPVQPATPAADVKTVQNWLNTNYKTGLKVDGVYGKLTKAAHVKALQTELNKLGAQLKVDGVFGKRTKSAMHNLMRGDKGSLVQILQGLLICNGYTAGGFDGVYGIGTEAAVSEYQYKKALTTDGIAGRQTFESLCN